MPAREAVYVTFGMAFPSGHRSASVLESRNNRCNSVRDSGTSFRVSLCDQKSEKGM